MKKIIVLLILMLTTAALVPVKGQNVNVNIHVNIDRQPAWGPVGYTYVDFYYFPDLNIYYDVNRQLFHYTSRRGWVASRYLPPKYQRYDLYRMYKVVLTGRDPWIQNKVHKRQYAHFRGNRTQVVIRHSTDHRYQKSRNNTYGWVEERPGSPKTVTDRTSSGNKQQPSTGKQPGKTTSGRSSSGSTSRSTVSSGNTSRSSTTGTDRTSGTNSNNRTGSGRSAK
ncbi:MAG: hypothetical protein LUG98_07215 [Tannerellaceae bacterium]|nr:hypothetical protein [Tannerellaceae bacterium]